MSESTKSDLNAALGVAVFTLIVYIGMNQLAKRQYRKHLARKPQNLDIV